MVEYKKLMDIEETKRIVVPNDTDLSELRAKCCSLAQENGIYLEVTEDVVSSGGLFRAKNDPCLILNHPEHPNDYDRFCCMEISMKSNLRLNRRSTIRSSKKSGKICDGGAG